MCDVRVVCRSCTGDNIGSCMWIPLRHLVLVGRLRLLAAVVTWSSAVAAALCMVCTLTSTTFGRLAEGMIEAHSTYLAKLYSSRLRADACTRWRGCAGASVVSSGCAGKHVDERDSMFTVCVCMGPR